MSYQECCIQYSLAKVLFMHFDPVYVVG